MTSRHRRLLGKDCFGETPKQHARRVRYPETESRGQAADRLQDGSLRSPEKISRRQIPWCVTSGSMLSDFLELDHETAGTRCRLRSLAATANVQRVHWAEEGLRKVGTFGRGGKKAS